MSTPCHLCGGVGYLERITDRAMVQCLVCRGSGREQAGERDSE